MSKKRRESAPWRKERGPNGWRLCACGCGREAEPPRKNWHSSECVRAWKLINDPQTIRRAVEDRDKGICAACGLDTNKARADYRAAIVAALRPHSPPSGWGADYTYDALALGKVEPPVGFPRLSRTWWEADHIIPVVEGGGQCGLENYRTLCCPCHRRATAELAARRAAARRQAKQPELSLA